MHKLRLAAVVSLGLLVHASEFAVSRTYGQTYGPTYGSPVTTGQSVGPISPTTQYGSTVQGGTISGGTTGSGYSTDGIRGSVRTGTKTRSVRTPSSTSRDGYRPYDSSTLSSQRDYDDYPSDYRGGTYRDDAYNDRRIADGRSTRDTRSTSRTYDSQNYDSRDDELIRGRSTTRTSRASDRYASDDGRLPPLGSRDGRDEHPESLKAGQLLKMWIEPPRNEDPRRILSLYDAISRVNGPKEQIDVVKIYWGWVLAMAELRGMADEEAVLGEISRSVPPRTTYEQSLLRSAVEACHSREAEAKRDVIARLVDLQEVSGQRSDQAQIPGDFPFVGEYDTRFERTFGGRTAPANLRKIHNTLPEDLKVIRSRAAATDEAVNLMADSAAAYVARQIPLSEVLESVHALRSQRRAFLEAVHHYNSTIAEYSLSVANGNLSREGIVSMLIGTQGRSSGRQSLAYGGSYVDSLYARTNAHRNNYTARALEPINQRDFSFGPYTGQQSQYGSQYAGQYGGQYAGQYSGQYPGYATGPSLGTYGQLPPNGTYVGGLANDRYRNERAEYDRYGGSQYGDRFADRGTYGPTAPSYDRYGDPLFPNGATVDRRGTPVRTSPGYSDYPRNSYPSYQPYVR